MNSKMNILFYIPYLSQDMGGLKQYSKGILEIMAKETNNKYFIYHNNDEAEITKVLLRNPHLKLIKDIDIPNRNGRRFVRYLNRFLKKIHIGISANLFEPINILCKQYAIDIIHCPYQFIPNIKRTKLITTLHDVQELHFPEFFTPQERARRAVYYMDYLFRADKIIVSYVHVKNDLIKYFQIPENKIDILLINMNDLWINHLSEDNIVNVNDITNGDDFLLYPANTWSHKNHLNLIKAVSLLRDKFDLKIKVICTGKKHDHYEEIHKLVKELNLEKQIIFPDVLSEEVLYSLYKACRAVVVPSLYEAGSFPLYESILLNVPVICSNVTSLPETISNVECLFNPFDIECIALKIKEVWTDESFRNSIKENFKIAKSKISSNNPLPILQKIYDNI